jgi:uracil DNA glycosylase
MDWKQLFKDIDINSNDILNQIYQTNAIIYPKFEHTFKSFHMCPLEQLKVVIIGQYCYHGPNQPTGLSFCCSYSIKNPSFFT